MNQQPLVFGAQYYRCPTPLRNDWKSDIHNIKLNGFNTIKIWAQWRTNNPQKGVFVFSDIRELLDIAEENGIHVIINIILDVAPAWFFKEYPESVMVQADGRLLKPQVTEYRQVGGAPGPCYHHEEAARVKKEFVETLANEFREHPALLLWDLWNEPELTCGLSREADENSMVCYCSATEKAFKEWLAHKYLNIDQLNATWQRNYNDFDEVELPRNPRTFRDMIDWRTFFADTLAKDLEARVQSIKKLDSAHPVMVHTVPPPYFNMINACCDDYKMAKLCDLFGNSIASEPFPVALNISSAAGKEVMNSEIHAVGGETFNRPGIASFADFKKHIFTPFARGIKGFMFWQYRPELLGRESPAWGLTDLNGESTEYLEYARRINETLQKYIEITGVCKPLKSEIAIIKDNNNEIFSWCANSSAEKYNNSVLGAFHAFYDLNYNVDIISPDQLTECGADQYKLIYYPLPYYMSQETASFLRNWISKGGIFISEAFFGAYRAENGLHSTIVPGYDFCDVFGAKESRAMTASRFIAAYGEKWWESSGDLDIAPINFNDGCDQFSMSGYFFYEEFQARSGKAIGTYKNNTISIIQKDYEKGKAIIAGSLIGYGYEKTKDPGNLRFFNRFAEAAGVKRFVETSEKGVRADVLYAESGIALVISNQTDYIGSCSFTFDSLQQVQGCLDAETESDVPFIQEDMKIIVTMKLEPFNYQLLIFKLD